MRRRGRRKGRAEIVDGDIFGKRERESMAQKERGRDIHSRGMLT